MKRVGVFFLALSVPLVSGCVTYRDTSGHVRQVSTIQAAHNARMHHHHLDGESDRTDWSCSIILADHRHAIGTCEHGLPATLEMRNHHHHLDGVACSLDDRPEGTTSTPSVWIPR